MVVSVLLPLPALAQTQHMAASQRSVLIVLADGAHTGTFEALLAAGELPRIQRHVIDRGSYRRGTTTFASTTGPAHIPILTGCFAGTGGVPGYRWFEREAYRPGLPTGPRCLMRWCRCYSITGCRSSRPQ